MTTGGWSQLPTRHMQQHQQGLLVTPQKSPAVEQPSVAE